MIGANSPLGESARAGRPIGVGIIGLGAEGSWAGRAHVPALRAVPGFELRALSASSAESAARSGEVHGVSRTFGSAAELARCDEVDLVVVAVKVPHHRELVTAAVEAGKAVLCEWTLGNGAAESAELEAMARAAAVPNAIGLQARSSPVVAHVRRLVADGYVGEVLSTTVVGTGSSWGAETDPRNSYNLDEANGVTVLTIPFAHTLDGVAYVLGEPEYLRIEQARRRRTALDTVSGKTVPFDSADQVVASVRFPGGVVGSMHYRGGTTRGEGLHWEINGTEGDLVVTAPSGHMQLAPLRLFGGRGTQRVLAPLDTPPDLLRVPGIDRVEQSPAYAVAHAYQRMLDDLRTGSDTVPDFAHATHRHQGLEAALG
ncbi:Gfo/Idh/MocA family protein [Nocardia miyunensis]|uniref:Gfo/Idh/MocA family protein n=1 Tax=Nocardia miyunensis TaxID=282684 RepID=UPI000B177521|nr:Gfo/Idh/MocA family oxidoreductase [Nocardia miyunensis]